MISSQFKLIGIKTSLAGILILALFVLVPKLALAASVYLTVDDPAIAVGDTIIVNLEMDTLDKNPNVVEGDISIQNGAENINISEFSLADSVLTHWIRTPFLESDSKISFTGGVPGGFNQKSGLLFKIIFLAKEEGQVVFLPANIKAYDNDGKATPIEVSSNPLTITIGSKKDAQPKNQWLEIISKDNQPPRDLAVTVGQDSSIFEGKKFITISAVDNQSGIDHYEVKEGDRPAVQSGATYVLQDQSESSVIVITAYDKAGNYSKISLEPGKPKIDYRKLIIILIIALPLFYVVFRIFKLVKKKNV